jgi:WD40 repeat protein
MMFVQGDILKSILNHLIWRDRIHFCNKVKNKLLISACLRLEIKLTHKYTLEGHEAGINCLLAYTNGKLISGSNDAILRIWGGVGYICLKELRGHKYSIRSLISIPNFDFASGSEDRAIRVWSIRYSDQYYCKYTLEGHNDTITSLLFLSSNLYLISGSSDQSIRIWDSMSQYKCIKIILFHNDTISCLISVNNDLFASASYDKTLKLWNAHNYQYVDTIKAHKMGITCLLRIKDGCFATGSGDKTIKIWDGHGSAYKCIKTLKGHKDGVTSMVILPDGCLLSAASNVIRMWDCKCDFKLVNEVIAHGDIIWSIVLLNNDDIATCSKDTLIKIWGI